MNTNNQNEEKIMEIDIENEALALINDERIAIENGVAFITDRVAINPRNLIRVLRKNYWGVFDEPVDPVTGRKKIWPPLTQSIVDSVIKNYDIDTKNITVRAKKSEDVLLTSVVRGLLVENLDKIYFGEYLDEMERTIGIDGTAVWKVLEYKDEDGMYCFDIKPVDLLNFYIDPLSRSINDKDTKSVIERAVVAVPDLESNPEYINNKDLPGRTNIHPTDSMAITADQRSSIPLREVNERHGLIPKSFITGKKKDANEYVNGRITASGIGNKMEVIHEIVEVKKKNFKPYEEFWYQRVPGRWYGRGPAEMVMMLQLWMNIIINIRINRSYVNQLGLFKVKKGAGITAQMLSRLASNGVVQVNSMDDIEQMVVQEASQASYNDEGTIMDWSQRVTQAFEVVTGETLPSGVTATVGAIQNRNAMSSFAQIQKGLGMSLERFLKRQVMPIIKKNLKLKEVLIDELPLEDYQALIDAYAVKKVKKELGEMRRKGMQLVSPELIQAELQKAKDVFKNNGGKIYWKDFQDVNLDDFDVFIDITNEKFDKAVTVQNLIATLQIDPQLKTQILPTLFDLMGLRFRPESPELMGQPQAQPQAGQPMPAEGAPNQSMMNQITQANIAGQV